IVGAVPMLVRVVVTPAIAFAADRGGDRRRFLVGLTWAGLACMLLLGRCGSFWPILLLAALFAVAAATVLPLTETVAMGGVRGVGLDYGRMRLWGSLSFIAASFWGGLAVSRLGAPAVVWLMAGGAALTVLAAHGLPHPAADGSERAAPARPRLSL